MKLGRHLTWTAKPDRAWLLEESTEADEFMLVLRGRGHFCALLSLLPDLLPPTKLGKCCFTLHAAYPVKAIRCVGYWLQVTRQAAWTV